MLICAFVHQPVDSLKSRDRITPVSKLAAVSAQPAAEVPVFGAHVLKGFRAGHSERLQRRASTDLRNRPCIRYRALELPSQLRRQRILHGQLTPDRP